MKIAVSSTGLDINSSIDPRFGRCSYFAFVDTETMDFEAIENPNAMGVSGVGIQSAQLMMEKGAKTILTGSCGPNAFSSLQAAGIEVIIGATGTVKEAVEKHKAGELKPASQAAVGPGFGMGQRAARPFGGGRGMGRGGGKGRRGFYEVYLRPRSFQETWVLARGRHNPL